MEDGWDILIKLDYTDCAVKQGLICIKFIEQLNYIHVILALNLIW